MLFRSSKEITRDKVGCINISDDILVFGRNQKEHDQKLEKLFKRAREKEITFNKDEMKTCPNLLFMNDPKM